MRDKMQGIYKKQEGVTPEMEHVISFLRGSNDQKVMEELEKRKLTEAEMLTLEGEITKPEMKKQLFEHMKAGSAPGQDGFMVRWVRAFWPDLEDLCLACLNGCYSENELTTMLDSAIMKVLRKGEKCPLEPGNYRPISLLSVFYKIGSGCITRRLETVMEKIIGRQQKAYSRERNIGSILLNLLNLMDNVNKKKKESLILLVDFKKAFDSINTKLIDSALKVFNFGESFRKWVTLLFTGRKTYLLLHGFLGEAIELEQGVPQGDVLSPYILNICVEILLIKISYTDTLKGVKYANKESRAECFADDTTVFIERSEANLRALVKIIKDFANISGLHANLDKTMVVPIGGNFGITTEDQICTDLKLVWVNSFRLLGLDIDSKLQNLQKNYNTKFLIVEDIIEKWKRRKLTTPGRIAVAKALLLSQYVYSFTCIDISKNMIKDIQNQLDNFIRGETKRKWISEDLMYTPKEKGGIGFFKLEDFISGLKITWMRRYGKGTSDHWANLLDAKLGLTEWTRKKAWKMGDIHINDLATCKLQGLSGIAAAYQKLQKCFPQPVEEDDNSWFCQPFFRNSNIVTKVHNRNRRGFKMLPIDPTQLGLPKNLTINLKEFYDSGRFKDRTALENLIRIYGNMEYKINENTILKLQDCLKYILGNGTHHDGIKKSLGTQFH